ncbi:MAG: hypothetical protein K6E59_03700 [Bacilli bacterium]|nr:hypothetical protein [Bacilli bacterium]
MAEITRGNCYRTVALLSTRTEKGVDVATGVFLLGKDGTPYLFTAGHFGKHVNASTLVELPNGPGMKPSVFSLLALTQGNRKDSPLADLSAFPLTGIKPQEKKMFTSRFITYAALLGDGAHPLNRETELTTMGFPEGLGHDVKGCLVPLSFRTYASSDCFYLRDEAYKEPLQVFALENASLGGYSGAPVFDLGSKNNGLVGFIKGNLDAKGGSIAIVTPAIYAKYLM